MESPNDQYLRQAEYCRKMAEAETRDELKTGWLALAQRWLEMIRDRSDSAAGKVIQGNFESPQAPGSAIRKSAFK